MADPVIPVAVGAKVTDANVGEFVIFRNLTRGGKLTGAVTGATRNVVLNPAPSTQWQNGDLIQLEIRGRLQGVAQSNIANNKVQFGNTDIGAVADTTTPGVSL